MNKIPAGCREGVCPSVQVLLRKTVPGYRDGETKQGSERDMKVRTDREEREEKVEGDKQWKLSISTFNTAASQHAVYILQGLIGFYHGSPGAPHFL